VPRDGYIVGWSGVAVAAALVVAGIVVRRRHPVGRKRANALLSFGAIGLVASTGWLMLGAYIDSVTR
jgi:hypothetical protein